jgi:uncharacterized phage-associated protein
MATALDVARLFIQLAAAEDEAERLTQMRLHKLLYYAQGWSLALRNTKLFDERIEAWAHGPVVRDLYPKFAKWDDSPIASESILPPEKIIPEEYELIGSTWEAYKGYTAAGLRAKTHSEPPWVKARGGCGPSVKCENEVRVEDMNDYFRSLSK